MLVEGMIGLLISICILYYITALWKRRRSSPPGPLFEFPILGHLPLLGTNPSKTLLRWGKHYGPVISVRMGSYPAIVINDPELIRQAFSKSSFCGRPSVKFTDTIAGNRKGITFADGPKAIEQRKFSQTLLKNFGYGHNSMETRVLDMLPDVLELFEHSLEKPLHVKHAFNLSMFAVLWNIVAGARPDKNDRGFQNLIANVSKAMVMTTILEKLAMFVKFIPDSFPEISGFNEKVKGMLAVQKFLDDVIETHKGSKVAGEPRDLMDAYLDRVEGTSDPESPFFAAHGNITFAMQELFIAGVETTGTTMEWLMFYMAKYPQVQVKLQNEIFHALGTSRFPSSDDRLKLPYAEAVVQEVLRKSSIIPLSLFHSTLEDTELNGYTIPKGRMILANLYAAHHSKGIWGDPETFRPERFLDSEGKFVKSSHVLAFSCGKRSCIGTKLAELQLFLYTVSIFQSYGVEALGDLPSEMGNFGLVVSLDPFQVRVRKRSGIS